MKPDHDIMDRYLDEVAAHVGKRPGRRDILLELRSAILDRAEEIGGGEVSPDSLHQAIEALGDPADVALAYVGERYLIGPRAYRPFLIYTAILFAVHFVLVVVATLAATDIEIFPLNVIQVARPRSFLNIALVGVQALLMDIGLMVLIFTFVARGRRTIRLPRLAFRVQAGLRPAITRALLALLVMIILTWFRDDLFIVMLEDRVHPLFTRSFGHDLVWINVFLTLVIAKEAAYAFLGERHLIVAADGVVGMLGVVLMLWLIRQPVFLSFPTQVNAPSVALPTLNELMGKALHLILIVFAVAFALEAVKRFIRLRQMWE